MRCSDDAVLVCAVALCTHAFEHTCDKSLRRRPHSLILCLTLLLLVCTYNRRRCYAFPSPCFGEWPCCCPDLLVFVSSVVPKSKLSTGFVRAAEARREACHMKPFPFHYDHCVHTLPRQQYHGEPHAHNSSAAWNKVKRH